MKAKDLLRYASITYRQLDHWCTKGWLVPYGRGSQNPGIGNDREFSREQADKARLMSCLISSGFVTHQAEKIAQAAAVGHNKHIFIGHGLTLMVEPHNHS